MFIFVLFFYYKFIRVSIQEKPLFLIHLNHCIQIEAQMDTHPRFSHLVHTCSVKWCSKTLS